MLFVLAALILYGCVSQPSVVQSCSLRNVLTTPKGLLFLSHFEKEKSPWVVLNLSTLSTEHHPILGVFERIPPKDVDEVNISPSGKWVAYTGVVRQHGYYIKTVDGLSEKFVSPENYVIVYSEKWQRWFLQPVNPRSLSEPIYPFLPNEQEQKSLYSNLEIDKAKVATNWIATSGTKEIPTLVVTDGIDTFSYIDWENEWQSLDGWLNENTLILTRYGGAYLLNTDNSSLLHSDRTILFNPFNGERLVSGDNYPNMSIFSWAPVYSPSNLYILYLDKDNSLIVVDRKKNITVLEVEIPPSSTVPFQPSWINETDFVYFVRNTESNTDEWFLSGIPGKKSQLSNLRHYFDSPTISSALPPMLSPAKDFLSFWITHMVGKNTYKNQLLFLNVQRRKIYDFCITVTGNIDTDPKLGQGWLEEGKYIFTIPEENSTRARIIDIVSQESDEILIPGEVIIIGGAMGTSK